MPNTRIALVKWWVRGYHTTHGPKGRYVRLPELFAIGEWAVRSSEKTP